VETGGRAEPVASQETAGGAKSPPVLFLVLNLVLVANFALAPAFVLAVSG
jgi:hypothetical protein